MAAGVVAASNLSQDLDQIPCWVPSKLPRPFDPIFTGWVYKQGHQIKNWKYRYIVMKGPLLMYYKTDLIHTQKDFNELPKGIHIITGLKEYRKAANGWIMETLDNKPFKIKVNTEAEKKQIVSMMKYSIKCYEKQFKGHGWDCKITLPVALVTVGHLDLAIELLETFVHLNPTLSEGFYHLGTAFMMRDQPEALENAYQSLQSCVELEPNHYFARANLGMVCFMKGDLEEAKRVLVGVLSDSPTCVEAANNLAIVLVHRGEPGDLEFAESKLQYAIQTNSNHPGLYLTYTDVLLLMGQTTAAIEMLQKAVGNISPKSSLLYGRIGELIYAEGDKETGIEYLTEAVDIDPRNKRALEMLQHALRRRAESQAETLVTTDSSDLMEEEESQLTESVSSLPLSPPLLDRSVSVSETNTTSTPLTRNPPRKRVSMFF